MIGGGTTDHRSSGRQLRAERVPADETRRVAMLIYPGIAPLDVAGPLQVFGLCNFMRKQACYAVETVAATADPIETQIGITFLPTTTIAEVSRPIDTLLVSGGFNVEMATVEPITDFLRRECPRARRYGSICTGTFALGAAGLIDGRRVTTHWLFVDDLARRFPKARVEVDPIFVRDGPLYTSAGITAGIDLGLALLEEDFGRAVALEVARSLVTFLKRSGGQEQFSTRLKAQFSAVSPVQRIQQWCLDNLDGDLRVAELARRAAMSERNFARAFREETGRTPAEFVAAERARAACRMLEDTDLSLKTVAVRCGFGSAAVMRRNFLHRFGVTPNQYREKFQL